MIELGLLATADNADAVSDLLLGSLGALSVSVEDADAGTAAEQARFGEPGMPVEVASWHRATVKALFENADAAHAAAAQLLASVGADAGPRIRGEHDAADSPAIELVSILPVADQDWVRLTQSQFGPTEIADGFWIVPSWHAAPAAAGTVLRLDPGMAFGTGTHPTTRMCLRWIAARGHTSATWGRVLDYGCGSGILAIGAGLHGANEIDAVDIDPDAIEATRVNAAANNVHLHAGLPELARGPYRVVMANILSTPLKLLAPLLCDSLGDAGELILAGILERQADEVAAAYAPWLVLQVADQEDGWVLMSGTATPARRGGRIDP